MLEIENPVILCDNIDYAFDVAWSESDGTIERKKNRLDVLLTIVKQKQASESVIC